MKTTNTPFAPSTRGEHRRYINNRPPEADTTIALFEGKRIRKTWYKEKWWFVIIDVVAVLTDSIQPDGYIKDMRRRDPQLSEGWGQIATLLSIQTEGGPQKMNCANTEGILRIIQSIPSPKAEPFKLWLARIGKERIDEIENPELAVNRAKQIYEKKGYSKNWIDKRLRGIAVRHSLTDEWRDRGVRRKNEYAILTNEIMQGAFDMKVNKYKKFKGLDRQNLRDHMTDLEIILT
ncbi:Bro-N domain-containing protein, partial [Candidatus Peregrinibacteria bacterium]|nr:Bro-N domain-containing protein [Candidatus Peregrinibacteria bacterium]